MGGFQYRTDAERFLQEFREPLAKFGLELHADKTRLIEPLGMNRFAIGAIHNSPVWQSRMLCDKRHSTSVTVSIAVTEEYSFLIERIA